MTRDESIKYLREHNWGSRWGAGDCTVLPDGWKWVSQDGKHPHCDFLVHDQFERAITFYDVFPEERPVAPTTEQRITAVRFDQSASESASATASDRQVGGEHYKSLKIQPIEYIDVNNLPYLEGNVIKYVTRHASKNGVQDIDKAIHYLELIKQFRYGGNDVTPEEKATMSFSEAGRKYLAALRGENVK